MADHSMMAHDADAAVMRMYFEEIELNLLEMIRKRADKGKSFTADDWIMNQSREVRRLRNEMERYGIKVKTEFTEMLDVLIDDVYADYSDGFRTEFEAAGSFGFNAISLDALNTLKNEQKRLFNQAFGKYIKQNVQDYQSTMNEAVRASVQVESGNKSFYQAVKDGVIASAEKGLTGFTDTAGRKWTMPTYMDMFVKTTMFNVANQALFDEMQDHNHELMIISQHAGACSICSAWQGKIISMSGRDERYPSYDDLVNAGMFHPNCEHTIAPYFPGFTKIEDAIPYDPDKYQARQKQRYYERQMRKWRRVEAVADSPEKKRARGKVNEYYTKLMDHIDANNLKRNPQRERIMQVERNIHARRVKLSKKTVSPRQSITIKNLIS